MSIIGTVFEDVTSEVLGPVGPWQWLVTILSMALALSGLFNHFDDMFLLEATEGIICASVDHDSFNISLCHQTNETTETSCTKWQVKLLGLVWVKKTWIVSCEDHMQKFSMAIVCRLGSAFGHVIFGIVADSFGRKRTLAITIFSELPLSILLTFYDSESWFRLFIFLRSLVRSANGYIALILICEIASNSWRAKLSAIVASPIALGSLFVLPLVNCMPNVDTYTFLGCLLNMGLLGVLKWTPESPQWLIFNRKISKAERIICHAAKKNKITLCDDFKIRPINHRAYACLEETTTCVEILTTYNVRVTSLEIILLWFMYEFLWSVLYLLAFESPPRILVLVTFSCLIPYNCLAYFVAQKLNTKHVILLNALVEGTLTTSLVLSIHLDENWRIVLMTVALTSAISSRYLILNITPRLFPINVRATYFGVCQSIGQIGSIICCILMVGQKLSEATLAAIVVSITLAMVALCFALPVTDNRELPDVIEDMDYFSELTKPMRWVTQKTNRPSLEEIEMRVYSFGSGAREESPPRPPRRAPPRPCHRLWAVLTKYLTGKIPKCLRK